MQTFTRAGRLCAAMLLALLSCVVLAQSGDYRLQKEDVLTIEVRSLVTTGAQIINIRQDVKVGRDGNITPPFLGSIAAEGRTVDELQSTLKELYVDTLLVEEETILVSVTVSEFRPIRASIVGAVSRPGTYIFQPGDTILTLLAQGGGALLENRSDLKRATFSRQGSPESIPIDLTAFERGDLSQNYEIQDGDRLIVPEKSSLTSTVVVWGKVQRPGAVPFVEGLRVLDAISATGGEIPGQSKFSGTYVLRRRTGQPNKVLKIETDLVKYIRQGDVRQNIELMEGDVIVVPDSGNPDFSQINNVLGLLFVLERFGLNLFGF